MNWGQIGATIQASQKSRKDYIQVACKQRNLGLCVLVSSTIMKMSPVEPKK